MVIVCLLVFTEPGRRAWTVTTDWASDRATDWFTDTLDENQAQRELRDRLAEVEPMCGNLMKPKGFKVSGGEAIALVVGKRRIGCEQVDLEPMGGVVDAPVWAVHVNAKKTGGCTFSAEVDATTAEVGDRYGDCFDQPVFITHENGSDPHDARVDGRLVFRDNCFRVAPPPGAKARGARGTVLPIWPHGFSYRGKPGRARILDRHGEVVARVGDQIVGGGMVTDDESFVTNTGGCSGPYWLMGPVIERRQVSS